ncbi:uncharacterized protein LOC128242217 [Mya arenaria]|nr:uncharacterized protein LOC128242217 [Mya arenaria]
MWDWLTSNLRRRCRRRNDRNQTRNQADEEPMSSGSELRNFLHRTREQNIPFFRPSNLSSGSPPKCLSRLTCSDILYGNRIEDFSTDCWLENRLHHFGLPERDHQLMSQSAALAPLFESDDDSITTSNDSNSIVVDYNGPSTVSGHGSSQNPARIALEELFIPLGESESDTDVDGPFNYSDIIDPPPYSEYSDDPPTYEEALAGNEGMANTARSRRSNTSRSTSSTLAFMW